MGCTQQLAPFTGFGKTSVTGMGKEVIGDTNQKKKFKYIEIFRLSNMNGKFVLLDICVQKYCVLCFLLRGRIKNVLICLNRIYLGQQNLKRGGHKKVEETIFYFKKFLL